MSEQINLPELPDALELHAAHVNLSDRFPTIIWENAQRFDQNIKDNPALVAFAYSMYLAGINIVGTLTNEVKLAVSEASEDTRNKFGKH